MEFSPFNAVVKLCLQGMAMEDIGNNEEAARLFEQGWTETTNDHERFLAAYYISRHQDTLSDTLKWQETVLRYAMKINDDTVKSALPFPYLKISESYGRLGQAKKSADYAALSKQLAGNPSDKGPFYHGTRANLKIGDLLTPGGNSNYKADVKMNHIYFTALVNGAGLAAALAKGEGREHVYLVEPVGSFENDPNLTDQKFPGNPTRSYRSRSPLKIIGEVTDWERPSPAELEQFRRKLEDNKGQIIN